jgi:hypothetical protein
MTISKTALVAALAACLFSARAFAPDFSVLLGGTSDLRESVAADAAKNARAAQAFGDTLGAGERRDLQSACTALVANERAARAQQRLQALLARYQDNDPQAVLRFCLDPAYRQLQSELEASSQALRRSGAANVDDRSSAALETTLEQQRRRYTAISNIMKTRHDTAKNSIGNVR